MMANTPDEMHFWGWETLADSELFTVHMDAKSSRITLHLNKVLVADYQAWFTFQYSDWTEFHHLVAGFVPGSGDQHVSACGSIEELAADSIGLTVGSLTICVPLGHFTTLIETVVLANQRIMKLAP